MAKNNMLKSSAPTGGEEDCDAEVDHPALARQLDKNRPPAQQRLHRLAARPDAREYKRLCGDQRNCWHKHQPSHNLDYVGEEAREGFASGEN